MHRLRHIFCVGSMALAACNHVIDDGNWRLVQSRQGTTVDTCSLLPADGSLATGFLAATGSEIRIDLVLLGASPSVPMIGRTKSPVHGEPDEFTVYGTFSDRALDLAGRPCTVHFGQIVLPAVIDEKRSFHGEITVHYGLVASQIDSCPLACDIAVAYRADLTAP